MASIAFAGFAAIADTVGPKFTIDYDGVLTGVDLNGFTDVVIPDSVTSIGEYAFYNSTNLASVTMLGGCPDVGNNAFFKVDASCVVYLPEDNATYAITDGKWQGLTVYYPSVDITFDANGGAGERRCDALCRVGSSLHHSFPPQRCER